ncbi:MAG TPA: 3-isopropylmalate dehydrogenase [Gemmatimonadaceae bacterium]|nr:3-isopropylmalate dehydrogenase [Gemmatimonadaceae bacterium]
MSGATARVVILPGDGVGPEVMAAARMVLAAASEAAGIRLMVEECLVGGAAVDATGAPLPAETLKACRGADAVLLGAVGGPRWDAAPAERRPERGLLELRRLLGVYANVRPVRAVPALAHVSPLRAELLRDVDLVIVRELTGGLYFGNRGRTADASGGRAYDVCEYGVREIERVARVAGRLARARRARVTSVDKANVLETSRLWREVVTRLFAEEFPDVALEHALVDSTAMRLVTAPASFDVVLTENMFGDILSDEAAVLAGSIGLLPSASLGDRQANGGIPGLYEPIHGSAPDIAGRGIANPTGAILSVAMLLRHSLEQEDAARAIERAVEECLESGVVTRDLGGDATTAEVAARVAGSIEISVSSI